MARIRKVLRMANKGEYAIVYVQMEDGDEEYRVYVGGDCETAHHNGVNKAVVKRAQSRKGIDIVKVKE